MTYAALSKSNTLTLAGPQGEFLLEILGKIVSKGAFAAHKIRLVAALESQVSSYVKARQTLVDTYCDQEQVDPEDASKGTRPRVYVNEGGVNHVKFTSTEQQQSMERELTTLISEAPIAIDLGSNPAIKHALTATLAKIEGDDCPEIAGHQQGLFYQTLVEVTAALAPAP
jgi:hypothetical protein